MCRTGYRPTEMGVTPLKKTSPGPWEMWPEPGICVCNKISYYFFVRPEGLCPSGRILLFPSARSIGQTLFQNFFKKVVFGG